MGTSTFAEYTVMPQIALAKVNRAAALDKVCLLACGATTGIAAALWKARVTPGSTCAIFGAGMVGLGAVVGSRLAKAGRIIVVDRSRERLELARRYGATDTVLASEEPVEQILDATEGLGAEFTFEATGRVDVMGQAVEAARMGWGLCTILGVAGKGETLSIVPRLLITGRRVQGGSFGGARGRTDVPKLVDLYLEGEIDLDGFVSHELSLDEVNRGFELMEAQDGIRSVIRFN
jgi:S-(hydroxymethyl)glutathione dehydrogenase/alcohol dehydrogenase